MSTRSIDQPLTLVSAILVAVVGLSEGNLAPLFVGAFDDGMNLGLDRAGGLAGAEILGMSLSAALAVFWIDRFDWRKAAAFALAVCIAGNLLTPLVTDYYPLLALRLATGIFGEGVAFAIGVAAIGEARNADRAYALMVMAHITWAVLGLFALPFLIEDWGVSGLVVPIGIAIALMIPFTRFLPKGCAQPLEDQTDTGQGRGPVFWAVGAQFVWYFGVVSLFNFIERFGNEAGFKATEIGTVLALGMALSLVGTIVATFQGDRYSRLMPFVVTAIVQIIAVFWLIDIPNLLQYGIAWIVINAVWNYGLPYIYSGAAAADYSGRYVVLIPAAQGFGGAVGVAVGGAVAASYGLSSIVYLMIGANVVAALLFAHCVRHTRKSAKPEPVLRA